jgi:hypothetical protein
MVGASCTCNSRGAKNKITANGTAPYNEKKYHEVSRMLLSALGVHALGKRDIPLSVYATTYDR